MLGEVQVSAYRTHFANLSVCSGRDWDGGGDRQVKAELVHGSVGAGVLCGEDSPMR